MTELWRWPATRLAAAIAERHVSPVEVVDAVIARAEACTALNVFALPTFAAAREAARAAEQAVMAGAALGPLHGVPITIKDNVNVAGLPTLNGTRALQAPAAAADATVSARIRAAGAILLGKTTLPEFAHRVATDSPLHGITRNPWKLDHTPGGSSGGASAAVAAGIAPLALGTDGGGSIRCPASCTGLVGLKATLGRIPNETFPDPFGNYAFTGPMARTAADAALLFSVLHGGDDRDPYSLAVPPPAPPGGIRGLRIGWIEHVGDFRTDEAVAEACRAALGALAAQGTVVEPLETAAFDGAFSTYQVVATTAHAGRLGPLAEEAADRMTPSLRESIRIGREWSGAALVRAMDRRGVLFRAVQRLFDRFDLIATPTLTAAPPLLDFVGSVAGADYAEWAAPLYPFNLTGHPAASVPAGFVGGLPIGLQLVGPWHAEQRILDAAAALEATLGLVDRWPRSC